MPRARDATARASAMRPSPASATVPPQAAWECGDCGWTVHAAGLPRGATLLEAIEEHGDKYCARPSHLPPG